MIRHSGRSPWLRMPRLLQVLLAVAAVAQLAAGGPLMAIDFGGEFIKVSVVKPGRTPISIVPNEMSKRRTSAAVAFVNRDRLLGEEAAALAVRYPDRIYTRHDLGSLDSLSCTRLAGCTLALSTSRRLRQLPEPKSTAAPWKPSSYYPLCLVARRKLSPLTPIPRYPSQHSA